MAAVAVDADADTEEDDWVSGLVHGTAGENGLSSVAAMGMYAAADTEEDDWVAGCSLFQLIETSCISGLFANATNRSYIDVFSCKAYDPDVVEELTDSYNAWRSQMRYTKAEGGIRKGSENK